jgi:hypothetical protein
MPIWLAWDRGPAPLVIFDVLRAFARGRIVSFACRSLIRHPRVRHPRAAFRRIRSSRIMSGRKSAIRK